MKRWALSGLLVLAATASLGQPEHNETESIRLEREAVSRQREAVMAQFEQRSLLCWQKFAVNACLGDARQARREALAPLRAQDLLLNDRERLWTTEQRNLRLESKQPAVPSSP